MSSKLNSDIIRLKDIVSAIADIHQFLEKSSFEDRMAVMAIAYEIAIMGEAASKLSESFRLHHSHIPWGDIIGMRHRIIHGYGKVSLERLKEVVKNHLPRLKKDILDILSQTAH